MRPHRPLSGWLSPMSLEQFTQSHLGQMPYARPCVAREACAWFDWEVLERVLAADPAPDVLVATEGRLSGVPAPRSLAEVRHLMQRRLGVVVRKAERHDEQLGALARELAMDLPGEVHVQLYVTPAGTQTFGWHFDREEVFIAQTVGTKDYYMRANTVTNPGGAEVNPDFSAVRRERSALLSSRLIAGDWLYIPARWWHLVRSVEDALSISIGVLPHERSPRAREAKLAAGAPSAQPT